MDFKIARENIREKIREVNNELYQKIEDRITLSDEPIVKVEQVHSFEMICDEDIVRIEDFEKYQQILMTKHQSTIAELDIIKTESYIHYQGDECGGMFFVVSLTELRDENKEERHKRLSDKFIHPDEKYFTIEDVKLTCEENSFRVTFDELSYSYEVNHPRFLELIEKHNTIYSKFDFMLSIRSFFTAL